MAGHYYKTLSLRPDTSTRTFIEDRSIRYSRVPAATAAHLLKIAKLVVETLKTEDLKEIEEALSPLRKKK